METKVSLASDSTTGSTCPVAVAQGFYDEDNGELYALPGSEYEHDTQVNVISLASESYVDNQVSGKESTSNKVTSISASSTDTQYPSAKCVYDALQGTAP